MATFGLWLKKLYLEWEDKRDKWWKCLNIIIRWERFMIIFSGFVWSLLDLMALTFYKGSDESVPFMQQIMQDAFPGSLGFKKCADSTC